jgi:flagellar biosynthesis/type III secretory pathway protein FliH
MREAISAYKKITGSEEFKELERLRERALHDEASALEQAMREGKAIGKAEGEPKSDAKWHGVIAEKDSDIAPLRAMLNEKNDSNQNK